MSELKELKKILQEEIDIYKDIPLSDTDILELVKGQANVHLYSDMHKFTSVDELISPYGACVILYETKPNFGHWTCLTLKENDINFFDPYGDELDSQLKYIKEPFKTESNQNEKYLSKLILESPYELIYNEYQFQKLDDGVKDCGRWCALRILLKDLTLEEFRDLFFNMYSDDLATYLTAKQSQLVDVI